MMAACITNPTELENMMHENRVRVPGCSCDPCTALFAAFKAQQIETIGEAPRCDETDNGGNG